MTKHCAGCHRTKPLDAFHLNGTRNGKPRRRSRCRDCEQHRTEERADYMRAYRAAVPPPPRPIRVCVSCEAPLAVGSRKRYCHACRAAIDAGRREQGRSGAGWHGFVPESRACLTCGAQFQAFAPHAKFCSSGCGSRAREATRPSKGERGYDREHYALRASWKPKVATGTVLCARCGCLIGADEPWDLDHDDNDRSRYLGPSHARCNRATSRHRKERLDGASRDW